MCGEACARCGSDERSGAPRDVTLDDLAAKQAYVCCAPPYVIFLSAQPEKPPPLVANYALVSDTGWGRPDEVVELNPLGIDDVLYNIRDVYFDPQDLSEASAAGQNVFALLKACGSRTGKGLRCLKVHARRYIHVTCTHVHTCTCACPEGAHEAATSVRDGGACTADARLADAG